MPSYKLIYFNARGSAEVSRLTFAVVGSVKWEDVRFQSRDDWLKVKPTYEAGTLPVLEVDGVQISQSQAILRYIGREYGLYGESNMQKTQVDVVLDDVRDFRMEMLKWAFEKDELKKEEIRKSIMDEKRPALVKRLEKLLEKNKPASGYFVGITLTIADIAVYELFESLVYKPGFSDMTMGSGVLKTHSDLVKSNPGIADWLQKRPTTDR